MTGKENSEGTEGLGEEAGEISEDHQGWQLKAEGCTGPPPRPEALGVPLSSLSEGILTSCQFLKQVAGLPIMSVDISLG